MDTWNVRYPSSPPLAGRRLDQYESIACACACASATQATRLSKPGMGKRNGVSFQEKKKQNKTPVAVSWKRGSGETGSGEAGAAQEGSGRPVNQQLGPGYVSLAFIAGGGCESERDLQIPRALCRWAGLTGKDRRGEGTGGWDSRPSSADLFDAAAGRGRGGWKRSFRRALFDTCPRDAVAASDGHGWRSTPPTDPGSSRERIILAPRLVTPIYPAGEELGGLGTWNLELGTWILGLGSWEGTWILKLGSWEKLEALCFLLAPRTGRGGGHPVPG
ncbi:hypothetical protein JHW43_007172 [Diplocarpon mali]|nr:hypothetical protein JHW43_007172 [Diplocarpon mali]